MEKKFDKLSRCYRGGPLVTASEIVKGIRASKIVFNPHGLSTEAITSLPSRIFETAGCGVFQLTEYSDILAQHFEIGKEIVCFKNNKELRDLIKYYLKNEREREEIAGNSQIRAYKEHTYKHRMQTLLNMLKGKAFPGKNF